MKVAITGAGLISPLFQHWSELRRDSSRSPADRWSVLEAHLGKRGHKYLSNPSKFLVTASVLAVEAAGDLSRYASGRTGVVVGTNQGDFWVRRDFDAVIRTQGAAFLNAVEAPNSSVNLPASQVSIRHQVTGPNLTLTNHLVAGAESLHVGALMLRRGIADLVLCGATEESRPDGHAAPETALGGACLLLLERPEAVRSRGGSVLGTIEWSSLHFFPELKAKPWCVADELGSALDQDKLWLISHCSHTADAVANVLSKHSRHTIRSLAERNGNFQCDHSLLPVLQILWLLANGHGGTVIIVSPLGHIVLFQMKSGVSNE